MNRSRKIPWLIILAAASCTQLHALESIGWNFDNGHEASTNDGLVPTDLAGAGPYAQLNWNNHVGGEYQNPGTVPFALVDNSGSSTGTSVTAWTHSESHSWHHSYEGADANGRMMNAFACRNPSIKFSNVPATYQDSGYSVVVYYAQTELSRESMVKVKGSISDDKERSVTTGIPGNGTSYFSMGFVEQDDSHTGPSNYTVISGLSDPDFTLSLESVNGANNNGITAVQIVKESGAPAEPAGNFPFDFMSETALNPVLTWDRSLRANSYRVFLWLDGQPRPTTPTATVTSTSYTVTTPLAANTYYLWYVVAVGSEGNAESPDWSFSTGSAAAPAVAEFPFPVENSTNVPADTIFDWNYADRTSTYEFYLWTDTKPATPTAVSPQIGYTFPAMLEPSTTYQWQVVTVNSNGRTEGPVWSFTTSDFVPVGRPSVGWNYHNDYDPNGVLEDYDGAGAPGYGQRNWNNHRGSGQGPGDVPFAMMDNEGNPSGITLSTWIHHGASNSWHQDYAGTDANGRLMNSYACRDAELTFTNIPPSYTDTGYSVVVYYGQDTSRSATLALTGNADDAISRTITAGSSANGTTWEAAGYVQETGSHGGPSNYTVFSGLNDAAFSLRLTSIGTSGNNGFHAVQIIQEEATPSTPSQPAPASGASDLANTPHLSWRSSLRATSYQIHLWKDGTTEPTTPTGTSSVASYDPASPLDFSSTYHWRVVALNDAGPTSGPVWSFTTGAQGAPDAAGSPSPASGATAIAPGTSFTWSTAARASQYRFYLWPASGTRPAQPTHTSSEPGYTPASPLQLGTAYSWQVVTSNTTGTTDGPVWTFTTGASPSAPSQPSPANLAANVSRVVTLDWANSTGATSYRVFLWKAADPEPASPTATVTASNWSGAIQLAGETAYLWKVEAVNSFGTSTGPQWSFTTTASAGTTLESIGWNYDNGFGGSTNDSLAPEEIAGIPATAQSNWNNHTGSGQGSGAVPLSLTDNSGAATGTSVTNWTNIGGANSWFHAYSGSDPNGKLLNAYSAQGTSITFSGVPANYQGGGYSVIVYYGQNGSSQAQVSITGSVDDLAQRMIRAGAPETSSAWASIGYVMETGSLNGPTNVTVFTGLNDPNFTVAITNPNGPFNNTGICAVQIVRGQVETGSAYETWAGAKGLTGGDASFDADPDDDGLANGLEFILGGEPNPANSGAASLAMLPVIADSGTSVTFTFTRTHESSGVEPIVEFNNDLGSEWTIANGSNSSTSITPGANADTVTVTIPKVSAPRLFVRLRVEGP
ncbi:hypothetical protein OKA04_18195 [Luteolibacter flavescens]|uniref:Fibronectin type-III domain-containing protein n=1 Tax=Luteolibacter flavescens TaxID=1859460 RepID=A0ABT3FUL1_9BACT|nr:hypothetical protein [Luteolibacter flavescens]MCW1886675.1 hypothetical protein [Luteolibacter flavescens]